MAYSPYSSVIHKTMALFSIKSVKPLLALFIMISSKAFASDGRVSLNLNISFGSHDAHAKIGLLVFGATGDTDIAAEAGAGLWAQSSLKRFGFSQFSWSLGYEAFGLVGYGNNGNLLGSTLSSLDTQSFFKEGDAEPFLGVGFGVKDELNPKQLDDLIHRTGKVYVRFSDNNYSYHAGFSNDLRESVFRGNARDYGQTASFDFGFAQGKRDQIQQYKLGVDLFTPKPDFNKAPSNTINSADGRKRVWFTQSPLKDVFNGNFYFSASQINDNKSWKATVGTDSKKWAAKLQNMIHDEFGLMPRFPWPVEQPNTLLWNITVSQDVGSF